MNTNITVYAKAFNELSNSILYEILKVRSDVFVVEQQCIYPDPDGLDENAIHFYILNKENKIVAYLRYLPKGKPYDEARIGRVLCTIRHQGYASILLSHAIAYAKENFNDTTIKLEAQTYARTLYEKAGFVQTGPEFLEDGIPHIPMLLKL